MINSEQAHQAQKLYKQTLLRLGEMLKILKQGDNSRNREILKNHCDYLSTQGKKQNLFGWVEIMETAKIAISRPDNEYSSTAKLIIKEIKNAGELLLQQEINSICVSDELQDLAPQAKARLMDVETVFADEIPSMEEIEAQATATPSQAVTKSTLDKDLWEETLFEVSHSSEEKNSHPSEHDDNEEDLDIFEGIGDLGEDDNLLEDWFEDDSFADDNPQISSVFLHDTSFTTNHDSSEEVDAFTSLFEGEDENISIDQWSSLEETEELEAQDSLEWESLGLEEEDSIFPIEDTDDSEYDSFVDDLSDLVEEDNSSEVEQEDYKVTISQDNLDIDDLDQLFTETERSTVIIDDPEEELENIINSLDDLEIEDDFPSMGSANTFQILQPVKSSEVKIVFYDEFSELNNVLSSNLSWLESDSWQDLELILDNNKINYYDQQSELERLVNSVPRHLEEVDWQQLSNIIEDLPEAEFGTVDNGFNAGVQTRQPQPSPFNDLDQLLAQAEKDRGKSPKSRTSRQGHTKSSSQTKVFEQSMRVPVKQLDNLNNLIGEMVVRRNRLEEDQEKLRQFLDNLLYQVQNLSDVSARMQDLYERSLLEGALMNSRRKNQETVKAQLARTEGRSTYISSNSNTNTSKLETPELDELELDRFTGFHLLSQEIIELIVKVRESASDIQFLVDETDQLGRNLREVTTQLQEGINKSRMVPFAQNADRLPLPIRKIAEGYNKQVQLKLEGRDVLIDKMILEHIWDPLLQITKNSVTHGIELPEEREEMGKPPVGTITVRAFLQGQQTVISVSDDGGGIDPQKIKKKAIQNKLITPAQAKNLKPQEVYDFLFHAGFTTKEKADSHAGRGVGLDIVRSKLNEIRGIVSIDSVVGQGTTFTIRLPLTVTVGKALCCLNDNTRIAFPMDAIEDTKDFTSSEIKINAQGQKCILWKNNLLPFRPLSTLLRYNRQITRSIIYTSNNEDETIPIIILRGGNNLLAIQVDQVLGQEEIVIKQISGPLPKPKGIAGATVRSDGIVMPIGDVIELIEIANGNLSLDLPQNLPDVVSNHETIYDIPVNNQPLVLIVDDSITVREMLSISFSKSGYRVEQARDGQEAWQKLRSGLPCDLVFCDIEMPRMNGLELLQHMQEDESLENIPVAILSSRGAEKHQRIAAELGASAYLIKPYVEKDLLDSAERMIKGEVLLAGSRKVPKVKINKATNPNIRSSGFVTQGKTKGKSARMVLIIDDSVVVREMLSMTFKKAGYQVEQARDGQDAWEQISNGLPCDLLLCDIEMPRMNGLELLAKMQQDENLSKLPVAMVTSRGAEKHRKIAADLGAKAYFTKPYLEEELLRAAEKLIEGQVLLNP
ncbi:response regulator [Cyanobacterium aponinum AL20118]|uniref:histidine kinase n=1 Tax=Cyanobacterium aponinum AL20115 TaxID=3090662 RepID=A0AAF0ZBU5_9CHRO|nr:response regulator [Cyanobacterium aponinum]WPF88740.1 response regulator [Cyanobacterium aponinum AL20115]